MEIVKGPHAAAVDVVANTLPVAGPVGPVIADNRIPDMSNDESDIA